MLNDVIGIAKFGNFIPNGFLLKVSLRMHKENIEIVHIFILGEESTLVAPSSLCNIHCMPVMDSVLRKSRDLSYKHRSRPNSHCDGILDANYVCYCSTSQ